MIEIKTPCKRCKAENQITLSDLSTGSATCKDCGDYLFSYKGIRGFVYLLSNPAIPGLVKIGSTARLVEERVKELNSATGVPAAFKVEAYFESTQPEQDEAEVHERLKVKRVENREFFRIDVAAAIEAVRLVIGVAPIGGQVKLLCRICGHSWSERGSVVLPNSISCPVCKLRSYEALTL